MTVYMTEAHWDYSGNPMVGYGYVTSGGLVRAVQEMLCYTVNPSLALDGVYGPETEAAIKKWQGHYGLTRDGIVGPKTWGAFWEHTLEYEDDELTWTNYIWKAPFGETSYTISFRYYVGLQVDYHLDMPDTCWAYWNLESGGYYWMSSNNQAVQV
jgi:hypothetical protein